MKEYFIEFLSLLANCVMVVCFAFVSFLIIINFYHYSEINNAYEPDIKNNGSYKEYKKMLDNVDKKINSVNAKATGDDKANVFYSEYETCKKELDSGSFNNINEFSLIRTKQIYDFNNEMLNNYNKKCIFGMPYDMKVLYGSSFDKVYKKTEEKRNLIMDSSEALVDSQLGNSSYGFSTYMTRATVYDKVRTDFRVTLDDYKIMASILNDVADWYVSYYGGAN